jgi:1-phosphatidylinositol-3-phosphate 5-kinase
VRSASVRLNAKVLTPSSYAQELNLISMFHLRIMLRQMLTKEGIPNITEWETTLLKLALQIARDLTFTAHPQRQGADMDVRRYVKIKKIPGGAPKDSEYVDGAVITKNVAHKSMSRSQRNPRVMLVTFPLEFQRVEGQYMHFGQVVLQEKEYLSNLAARIAALRPHIVLVEKSVSRIALDALAEHKIGVARSVKESAIQFVARMTQGDVFSSIDRLALEPRLGHCTKFQIQTFDHQLIPGRRKTYMRFEGCNKEMGCTILLRGGNNDTLTRIKRVTRFLTFIVRNLKLETHLWMDSVIALPQLTAEAVPSAPSLDTSDSVATGLHPSLWSFSNLKFISDSPLGTSDTPDPQIDDEDLPDDEAQQRTLTRKIQQSLDPYTKTYISVSATLRFQPPHPIKRMKELDDALTAAKRAWEDEIIRREEKTPIPITELPTVNENEFQVDTPTEPVSHHFQEVTITPNMDEDDIKAQIESLPDRIVSETPPRDLVLSNTNGYFGVSTPFALPTEVKPRVLEEAVPCMLKTVEDIRFESHITQLKSQHEEQRKIWEWYLRRNKDDFVVEKYQCIALWECAMPIVDYGSRKACEPPRLKYVTFYGEHDLTLGQFIDSSINDTLAQFLDPKAVCPAKGCGEPVARHCKVFVHNDTKLMVAVDQWDQIHGHGGSHHLYPPDLVTTWSSCRLCGMVTPLIQVSEEMQRYSFAKFLELHLYPADVQFVQGAGCKHNIYKHHVRYFSKRGMTVRFQTDPVNVFEVVYPPSRIIVRPESRLEVKNSDFTRLHARNILWYTALVDDLKLINIDAATGDEEADLRLTADINALILRAEMEKDEITGMINHVYKDTGPTDTLGLSQVRAYRQDKIVAWQQDFDRLPKVRPHMMSRKSSAFGSVRTGLWPRRHDFPGPSDHHPSSASVSEAEESARPPLLRKVTGLSFVSTSSTSDASEPEMDGALSKLVEKVIPLAVATTKRAATKVPETVKPASEEGSDGDSDSTIGAAKEDAPSEPSASPPVEVSTCDKGNDIRIRSVCLQERKDLPGSPPAEPPERSRERPSRPISRLPRRPMQQPSVAELVKKYQEFLPASGVSDLAKTAFPPGLPESEPEVSSPPLRPLSRLHNKSRHGNRVVSKKTSVSDFEQGYAANVAPRQRRPLNSRIPVPPPLDLNSDSRKTSPDRRPPMTRGYTYDNPKLSPVTAGNSRARPKLHQKGPTKDKPPVPRSPTTGGKSTLRRQLPPGSKVSNIAKHFERISRDNERSTRRYAVIRGGRKPRPVASARAKVEILDSVRDAVNDEESESSSESSEADDEGEGDDDAPVSALKKNDSMNSTISRPETEPEVGAVTESPAEIAETGEAPPSSGVVQETIRIPPTTTTPLRTLRTVNEAAESVLPSASTSPTVFTTPLPSATRPHTSYIPTDTETGVGERNSIFRALTGFWPGQAPQSRFRSGSDAEDPMADPEHIFREASMVVRTDEPTSIIALALKYVTSPPFSTAIDPVVVPLCIARS